MENELIIKQFKALSDPTRYKIFSMLKGKSLCACQILEELSITQPTLSFHMKVLSEASLVITTKSGTWNHYIVSVESVQKLEKFFFEQIDENSTSCEGKSCK